MKRKKLLILLFMSFLIFSSIFLNIPSFFLVILGILAGYSYSKEGFQKKEIDLSNLKGIFPVFDLVRSQLKDLQDQTERSILNAVEDLSVIYREVNNNQDVINRCLDSGGDLSTFVKSQIENNRILQEENERYINQQRRKIKENLERLVGIAQDIESLKQAIGDILDISQQINLLSLNANIEAARAGEAGIGFAVVADEIRKLSVKTQKTAERISSVIKSNIEKIKKEVAFTKQFIEEAESGLEKINFMTKQTGKISDELRQTSSMLISITEKVASANSNIINALSEVLGKVQFQDILRQRIEHVIETLKEIEKYLRESLERKLFLEPQIIKNIKEEYVMKAQRDVHDEVIGREFKEEEAPQIELF